MAKINPETIKKLHTLLCSWAVFMQKAHTYHWNVKGTDFKSLHEWFETIYSDSQSNMDSIAERIRQLGEQISMSLVTASANSVVTDDNNIYTQEEIVRDLVVAIGNITTLQSEIAVEADSQGDIVTLDLLTQLSKWTEMKSWFLSAYLGKENEIKD